MMKCEECNNVHKILDDIVKVINDGKSKPKDPVIYIPEGIEFKEIIFAGTLGLEFGNSQVLFYSGSMWMVSNSGGETIKTKLTPIDRKDLKAGDWAYINNHNRIDSYDLKEKAYYKLILDKKRHVCVGEDMNVRVAEYGYDYWWKVEKV